MLKKIAESLLHYGSKLIRSAQLLAAIYVASWSVIFAQLNDFDAMQYKVMKLALALAPTLGSVKQTPSIDQSQSELVVINIDDNDFEYRFHQTSPLNKAVLKEVLQGILDVKFPPAVLVINLDLSPTRISNSDKNENCNNSENKTEISEYCFYQYLIDVQEKIGLKAQLILSTPHKVFRPDLARWKLSWIKDLCEKNIIFGIPNIPTISNLALEYDNSSYALSKVVKRFSGDSGNRETGVCQHENFNKFAHQYMEDNGENKSDKISDTEQAENQKYKLINYEFLGTYPTVSSRYFIDNEDACNKAEKNCLKNRIVFLGGSYEDGKGFDTPAGSMSGIDLHVGSFYSFDHPVNKPNAISLYGLEVASALLLIWMTSALLSWFRNTNSLASIALNFILQPVIFVVLLVACALLLQLWDILINPAPILFGVGIYSVASNLVGPAETSDEDMESNRKWKKIENRIKKIIYIAPVGYSMYLLIQNSIA